MKTLFSLISIVAIANLLVIGGLVGVLVFSGRLNSESAKTIAAVLRGEKLVSATAVGTTTAPATQPATRPAPMTEEEAKIQQILVEQQIKAIEHRYNRLKDAELKLIQDREALKQKESGFTKQVKVQEEAAEDKGFSKALALYSKMPASAVKDDFMKLDPEIVVRYLMNMPERTSTKILKTFTTPAEQARRQDITERIRTQQALKASSGKVAGN